MFGCYGEEPCSSLTDSEAHAVFQKESQLVDHSVRQAENGATAPEQTDASLNTEGHK
jgi:hypothetical protein